MQGLGGSWGGVFVVNEISLLFIWLEDLLDKNVKHGLDVLLMHLPPFNKFGFLPPRDYEFTELERKQSSLVLPGQGQSKN